MKTKFIDKSDEAHVYHELIKKIKKIDKFEINPTDTLILNVSPDYSSIISQWMIHEFSKDGEHVEMIGVEVPYPDQSWKGYELNFMIQFKEYPDHYKNFVLVEAGVITGNNYTWLTNCMFKDFDITPDRILTTALYQNKNSIFRCDCVGEEFDSNIEEICFSWERENSHF